MPEQSSDVQKQKATITVDTEIVKKAKDAGINISATTGNVLKAFTYEGGEGNTRNDVIEAYEKLFHQMRILLNAYDTRIPIGKIQRFQKTGSVEQVQLDPYGGIVVIFDPIKKGDFGIEEFSVSQALDYLYSPSVILQNLIVALVKAGKKNERRISDLKMALRLVKAISDDGEQELPMTQVNDTANIHTPSIASDGFETRSVSRRCEDTSRELN
jgi:hypothetical protein